MSYKTLEMENLVPKVVLPRALNHDMIMKSPSGGTISFDTYCKRRLYRNNLHVAETCKS